MTGRGTIHCLIAGIALLLAGGAYAQTCNDFNQCTANDMCSDGECTGSFQDGGCDDNNACTINDRCQMDPKSGSYCVGTDPAPVGTVCEGGCGTCQPPFPGVPFVVCTPDPENLPDSCDSQFEAPCFEGGECEVVPGSNIVLCLPSLTECPDTDGNPCTDGCNFETGECQVSANECVPTCERCDPGTGQCVPNNVGGTCDDFNICTPQSSCQTLGPGTFCLPGEPTVSCVGDCNGNGEVAVNELVTGVNIALGSGNISQCTAFDRNSSGGVEVNELIGGVNSLLNGCA